MPWSWRRWWRSPGRASGTTRAGLRRSVGSRPRPDRAEEHAPPGPALHAEPCVIREQVGHPEGWKGTRRVAHDLLALPAQGTDEEQLAQLELRQVDAVGVHPHVHEGR